MLDAGLVGRRGMWAFRCHEEIVLKCVLQIPEATDRPCVRCSSSHGMGEAGTHDKCSHGREGRESQSLQSGHWDAASDVPHGFRVPQQLFLRSGQFRHCHSDLCFVNVIVNCVSDKNKRPQSLSPALGM